jgi:hypothetical protein
MLKTLWTTAQILIVIWAIIEIFKEKKPEMHKKTVDFLRKFLKPFGSALFTLLKIIFVLSIFYFIFTGVSSAFAYSIWLGIFVLWFVLDRL